MNVSRLAEPARNFLSAQFRLGRWLILGTILAAHGGAYLALKASMMPVFTPPPEPREIFAMLIAPPTPPQPQVTPPQPVPPPPEPVKPPPKPVVQKPKPKPKPKPKRAEPVIPAPVLPPSETAITQEAVEPVYEPMPPAPMVQADPAPPAPPAPVAPVAAPVPSGPRTISAVEYLVPPQPTYPPLSRRAGESGQVLLRILVNQAGRPEKVEVQKSSGYTRLDDAARQAAMRARFKPHRENGSAVAVYALVPVNFSIQ